MKVGFAPLKEPETYLEIVNPWAFKTGGASSQD
jgi:hypothetical protein